VSWGEKGRTHRLGWGLADQAISSMTNFLVVIFVAHSVQPREFGIFSLAYVAYGFCLSVSRGLATDPLVVRFSGVPRDAWHDAVGKSAGTAFIVGCVVGACCVSCGLVLGGEVGAAFLVLGFFLPGLMLQDSWRYAFFAAGEGRKSFLNDFVWGLALVPMVLLAAHQGGVVWFVASWAGAGCIAALVGVFQSRAVPRMRAARIWLGQQRELGPRYLMENLSMSAATQLRIFSVGAIAGLTAVGAVRGAEVLLGPWLAVVSGLSMVAVPEAARALRRSPSALLRFCTALAVVQTAGVAAWGMSIFLLVPDAWGHRILGSLWGHSEALLIPTTLAFAGIGLMNGAAAGLRALAAARRSLRVTLVCASAFLAGGAGGAWANGASGSAWGVAVATISGGALWWWQLHAGLRERRGSSLAPQQSAADVTDIALIGDSMAKASQMEVEPQ
jgi:O-antigen/teichoic acid export membrane protein